MNSILTKKELLKIMGDSWKETQEYMKNTTPAQRRRDNAIYERELAKRQHALELQETRENLAYLERLSKRFLSG